MCSVFCSVEGWVEKGPAYAWSMRSLMVDDTIQGRKRCGFRFFPSSFHSHSSVEATIAVALFVNRESFSMSLVTTGHVVVLSSSPVIA